MWVVVFRSGLLLSLCLIAVGCSSNDYPPLGKVSGKVTLDGAPMAGVIINFQPEKGRAATSETDAEGRYELMYRYGVKGGNVGKNKVSFAWPTGFEGGKAIPAKYAGKTELEREIKSGQNTFDFELTSK